MRISDWSSDVCSSDLTGRRPADEPAGGLQPQFGEAILGDHQASSRGIVLLARIACRDDTPFDGPQGSQRLERGIFAIALVPIKDHRGAPLLRNGNRDDLIIELKRKSTSLNSSH